MIRIGILTTSRADFGIYLPLLNKIQSCTDLDFKLYVGGMHMSEKFGSTYKLIENQGIVIDEKIVSLLDDDSPEGIANSIANTTTLFAELWKKEAFEIDLLLILGDRYEMFAAAIAGIPFNIPLAHIHGGEVTLGAIDNKFRNSITAFSDLHFVATSNNALRVSQIIGSEKSIFQVGSLGVEGLINSQLFSVEEFNEKFDFDISTPYVLFTYHSETLKIGSNKENIEQVIFALDKIPEKILCTMPNADTEGNIIRDRLLDFEKKFPDKIKCFENLGQIGYYTSMRFCKLMMGNSSSGIIEAASFNTPVVNIGDRQKGREVSGNVIHVNNNSKEILSGYDKAVSLKGSTFENVYGDGRTSNKIVKILYEIFNKTQIH